MNEKLISLLNASRAVAHDLRSYHQNSNNLDMSRWLSGHIEELKKAVSELEECNLATLPEPAHSGNVREGHDNDHLIHALHDLSKELVRATGEIRSLLLVLSKLDLVNLEKINMKVSELSGAVTEVKASALKAFSEIRNRIDAADARIVILETQLSDADIPAEAEAALADLKTIAKQLDDIVPDAPELPPVVNPPTPV